MAYDYLLTDIACLATCKENPQNIQGDAGLLPDGALAVTDGKVVFAGPMTDLPSQEAREKESAAGCTVTPGWIDPHTHLPYAGQRSNEFVRRIAGEDYEAIAKAGGGILASTTAVRETSEDDIYQQTLKRVEALNQRGTFVAEAKSGYGLSTEDELKQLRVIKRLNQDQNMVKLVPTFLGAHSVPADFKGRTDAYVDLVCAEMLPRVVEEKLAVFVDAFVEKGVFDLVQGEKIFRTAMDLGLKVRVHADELNPLGGAELAGKLRAASADHLICITDQGITALKDGGVTATMLPGTSFFLGKPYAPARKLIEAGVPLALATDHNPGSCTALDMMFIGHLACCAMKLSPQECLVAMTRHGADSLDLGDQYGSLEVGKQAAFLIHDVPHVDHLFYQLP